MPLNPDITRRFTFDSAHRVLGHKGKCRHVHGHTYQALVTVAANSLNDLGMVIDFSVVKEVVGGWINEEWDHNILLHPDDPMLTIDDSWGTLFGDKEPYKMPGGSPNPTAENIAKVLYWKADELLRPYGVEVRRVRIHETENCFADYPGA